jgi:ArsR family transcriptional regulator, arsenate/arsenite/antimonite-responsive transcriptional repressor
MQMNSSSHLTKTAPLNEEVAVKALAALAHGHRLRVFRALVVAGPAGLTPGVLSAQLEVAASALSFHLKELAYSDMVSVEHQGRNLIYRANFEHMNTLLAYLTEHCCAGEPCEVTDGDAICTTC